MLGSVFLFFQDIFKFCTDEGVTMVTELPYFEGDFWPNVLEEFIKELDQEVLYYPLACMRSKGYCSRSVCLLVCLFVDVCTSAQSGVISLSILDR